MILSRCNKSEELLKTVDRDEMVPVIRGTLYRFIPRHDINALLHTGTPLPERKEGHGVRKLFATLFIEGRLMVEILIKYRSDRELGGIMLLRMPFMTQDRLKVAKGSIGLGGLTKKVGNRQVMLVEAIPIIPTLQVFDDFVGAVPQTTLHDTDLATYFAQGHVRGVQHENPVCHVTSEKLHDLGVEVVTVGSEYFGIEKNVSGFQGRPEALV